MEQFEQNTIVDVKAAVRTINEPVVDEAPTRTGRSMLLGVVVVLLGFGGFLAWALNFQLDEGVPAQGQVVSSTGRKAIQHPNGGVVDQILVANGDKVRAGQPLVRLSDVQPLAAISIDRGTVESITVEVRLLQDQLARLRPLLAEGFYPRNQYVELQRQLEELKLRRKESLSKLTVSHEELRRTVVKAPVDGTVMDMTVFTVGAVIQPGAKIMEIAPTGDRLVVEVQIAPHLVDRIHADLLADVRFTALNQSKTPVMEGQVVWVSPDRQQDPQRPENMYYTARVGLKPDSWAKLKGETLQPGMPAEVIIKTGARTFWSYLIKPIEDRAALSLKER